MFRGRFGRAGELMRQLLPRAAIWLRHDRQRPASWLAGLLAMASVCLGAEPTLACGFAGGMLAAVIGIGELPTDLPRWVGLVAGRQRNWLRFQWHPLDLPGGLGWLAVRLLWPLTGLLAGGIAVAGGLVADGRGEALPAVFAGVMAVSLVGLTVTSLLLVGFTAADAATATLVSGWVATAVVVWRGGFSSGNVILQFVSGGATWLVVAASLLTLQIWLASRSGDPVVGALPRAESLRPSRAADRLAPIGLLGILPACSAWRRSLRAVAMGLLLVGMVGWLLLNPGTAAAFGLFACLVFGSLAIPLAALGDGFRVRRGWQPLVATTSAAGGWWWTTLAVPDALRQAAVVLGGQAAVVLWPPLAVLAVLFCSPGFSAVGSVVLLVAGVTVVVATGCLVVVATTARGETVQGVGLWLLAIGLWGAFPGVGGGEAAAVGAVPIEKVDVEKSGEA